MMMNKNKTHTESENSVATAKGQTTAAANAAAAKRTTRASSRLALGDITNRKGAAAVADKGAKKPVAAAAAAPAQVDTARPASRPVSSSGVATAAVLPRKPELLARNPSSSVAATEQAKKEATITSTFTSFSSSLAQAPATLSLTTSSSLLANNTVNSITSGLAAMDLDEDRKATSAYVAFKQLTPVESLKVDRDVQKDVEEYVDEIFAYMRRVEAKRQPPSNYMSKQPDLTSSMREKLIDWLVDVGVRFRQQPETLFLTVNYLDRFLNKQAVKRTKLQLVGMTAMLVASKYEEIFAPKVEDFCYICAEAFSAQEILAVEGIMLNALEFNLTNPTCYRFGQRFSKVANLDETQDNFANYVMESTLPIIDFLKFMPSMIASAAVWMARYVTNTVPVWDKAMENETTYKEEDLKACLRELWAIIANSDLKYKAVRRKYSETKYSNAATLKLPTSFIFS